jgi:hypothetical protein
MTRLWTSLDGVITAYLYLSSLLSETLSPPSIISKYEQPSLLLRMHDRLLTTEHPRRLGKTIHKQHSKQEEKTMAERLAKRP